METFTTLGDMLLRRYVVDYIGQAQNLAAPIWSRVPENSNFIPSGQGAYFPIRLDGNETGGAWRAIDDNQLPSAGNEQIIQAKVVPTKYYHTVSFSGIAEAVSARGGEDAFASAITDALSVAVTRAGANFEQAFLRSDGTGALAKTTNTSDVAGATSVIGVDDARPFRNNMVVEFMNSSGIKQAGPYKITGRDIGLKTITISGNYDPAVDLTIHPAGEQSGVAALNSQLTIYGLPAIVAASTGTLYGITRSSYPILDSKLVNASGASLDESMLRRLRKRIMVETAVGTTDNFVVLSNWEQYDRYTEIALPYRRFLDMRLELGASQEMTTFEGRPWLIAYLALPTLVYMLNMSAIERGTVRPFSLDERVNMQWIPGYDAFTVLFKAYLQTVARMPNQLGSIYGLAEGTY